MYRMFWDFFDALAQFSHTKGGNKIVITGKWMYKLLNHKDFGC